MSDELARYLLSAGYTSDSNEAVTYLLSVGTATKSFLNCQHWKGDTLAKQELIAESVRPGSTAAYIIAPSERLVICITASSTLSMYAYDEDDREWAESDESPLESYHVHPNGKLVGTLDAAGRAHVIFQDTSERLVSLVSDASFDNWTSTTLPCTAVSGTPISMLAGEEGVLVYYISSTDKMIHNVMQGPDKQWKDGLVSKYVFNEDVTAFCAGDGEFFVLTARNNLLKITREGVKTVLGTVKDGKYVPGTVEEAGFRIRWHRNGSVRSITFWD